jgi:cyclase
LNASAFRRSCVFAIAVGATFSAFHSFAAGKQMAKAATPPAAAAAHGVETWPIREHVYLLVGAGANITVQIGEHAVVVVNAGRSEMSAQVVSAIKELTDLPIEYVIDTNGDPDVVGGNAAISKSGFVNTGQPGEPSGAGIVSQLSTLDRLTALNAQNRARDPNIARIGSPTDTFEDQWAFFNGEAVMLYHAPHAHTDGDTYVFFRRSDVIATGDIFNTDRYPVIDAEHGGSLAGILDAMADIIAMMVPRQNEEGGTYLVPGRGRICDRTEIVNYHDALSIIQGRIRFYVSKGMTLEQVREAKPSFDYDGIYGSDQEPWTTRMFIDAVYREESLAKSGGAPAAQKPGQGDAK